MKLLLRDPMKRLGAGQSDAFEVKRHPFFAGVDWDEVLERRQAMPAHHLDLDSHEYEEAVSQIDVFGPYEDFEEETGKVPRWSFAE